MQTAVNTTAERMNQTEIWIDREARCLSFAPQDGYEQMSFSDRETMMRFVLDRAEMNYSIR